MPINGFTSGGLDLDRTLVRRDFFQEGNLWVWGAGGAGELGDNAIIHRSSPVQTVAGGNNWKEVTSNSSRFGLKTDGTLWSWGYNLYGSLGVGDVNRRSSPTLITTGGSNWRQASGTSANGAAIDSGGGIWTLGRGDLGVLGDATTIHRSTPLWLTSSNTWVQISVGKLVITGVKTDGTLWTWGKNYNGVIGDSTNSHRTIPTKIGLGTNWKYAVAAASGTAAAAAIKTDGTLWTWGYAFYGQLGDNTSSGGTDKSSPVQTVAGGTNWVQVNIGGRSAAATKTDGTLWVWGDNVNGGLGDNTVTPKSSPIQTISGGTNWKQVAVGYGYMAAIKTDGTLWTWGLNGDGQLGTNDIAHRSSPVQTIMGGTNWKQVSADFAYTAAISYVDP